MSMKKILSLLMAVAMVLSMVIVPAYAEEADYALKLADVSGNTTITATPGSSVVIQLTTEGSYPQFYHSIGGYVSYPEGWTVAGVTNELQKYYIQNNISNNIGFTNANEVDPVCLVWTGYQVKDGMKYELDYHGLLSQITLAIPETAELGTYDITLDTQKNAANYTWQHDSTGLIVNEDVAEDILVPAINCQIVVEEKLSGCPEHKTAEWIEVGEAEWGAGAALTTGHYRLKEAVTPSKALTVAAGQTVCIDLAGFNITMPSTSKIRAFEIAAGGTVTIIDATNTGVISGGKYGATGGASDAHATAFGGNIFNEGTFNLYGGTITGGIAYDGGVYRDSRGGNYYGTAGSVLNMYGGAITNGQAYTTSYTLNTTHWTGGANICSLGTVNISGGTISGGKVIEDDTSTSAKRAMYFYGGNIAMVDGTLNISGGTISGGTVDVGRHNSSTYATYITGYGGNIYASNTDVTISGGTISGGSVSVDFAAKGTASNSFGLEMYAFGGNLYMAASTLTMTGGDIYGGSAELAVKNTGETTKDDAEALARGANIYMTGTTAEISGGTITGGVLTKVDDPELTTDDYGTLFGANMAISSTATLTITGNANVSGGNTDKGGTIYNAGTLTVSGGQIGTPAVTDADGNVVTEAVIGTATYGGSIYNGGTLNVSGGVIYGGTASADGGNIYNTKTLTISGGIISDGEASEGGNVYLYNGATMTGGTVTGGTCGDRTVDSCKSGWNGGNFYLPSGETFTMSGGVISNGWASYRGAGIYNSGTFNLKGDAVLTDNKIPYTGGSWGGNIYSYGTTNIYDNAVVKNGRAERGANIHTSPSTGKIYMYGGAVYNGDAKDGSDDLRIGTGATANRFYMYGGYVGVVASQNSAGMYFYNGVVKTDITGRDVNYGACSHITALAGGYYNIWHADGTCETCGHSYGAYTAAEVTCATCKTSHETLGGFHTYTDGVCACGHTLPAHDAACSHGCENVTWEPFAGTVAEGGHYYLTDNVAMPSSLGVDTKVCIDLNGFVLTAPVAARALTAQAGAELTLMDSSAEKTGTIRGFSLPVGMWGGNLRVNKNGKLYLYDITVRDGLLNGTDDGNRGANIYNDGGLLVLENAKVLNGTMVQTEVALRGGNICGYNKHVTIIKGDDALVAGGNVNKSSSRNCYGGNLYSGSGGTLYIYGGTIKDGSAKMGGNLLWMNGDGSLKGYIYMYGGQILGAGKNNAVSGTNISVYGTDMYQNEFYMFGGHIDNISDDDSQNVIKLYGGTIGQDPTRAGEKNSTIVADCACVSFNEETGLFEIGHVNGTATCPNCAGNDKGAANGYSDAYTYTNLATHTYTEGCVCDNCHLVVAKRNDIQYSELTKALNDASAEDVVTLLKDTCVAGDVDIYTTLDLNGKALTVSGIVSAENNDAVITDSVGTGTATGAEIIMNPANGGMLSIDAENNGVHTYEKVDIVQKNVTYKDADGQVITDKIGVKFYIDKNDSLTKLDDALAAGSDVKIRLTVKWGNGKSHSFVYTEDLVALYMSNWNKKIFTCEIRGLDALGAYTVVADIMSNGVIVESLNIITA